MTLKSVSSDPKPPNYVLEKTYEALDIRVTVALVEKGSWTYEVYQDETMITSGPYAPKFDRELTLENVANHVATWYRDIFSQSHSGDKNHVVLTEDRAMDWPGGFPEMIRHMVWMEFYSNGLNRTPLSAVVVTSFNKVFQNWTATVENTNQADDRIYKVMHDGNAAQTHIDVYTKMDRITIQS